MRRKGLGKGLGQGYKNLVSIYDSHVHSLSAKGVKSKKETGWHESFNKSLGELVRKRKGITLKGRGKMAIPDEDYAYEIVAEFDVAPEWTSVEELVQWFLDGEISETTLRDRLYNIEENFQEEYKEFEEMVKKSGK